jgi:predicted  nucleic acid-binding Zn-ribbon protein
MPSFLAQIQALDTSTRRLTLREAPQQKQLRLEPRRARRQRLRDAAIAQKLTLNAKL